ncbi:HD domain-containing protein [Comamonas sp. w2-DMI]|uniref:HD domain-containing protein n=1 Tax=Comamonas sp. w2-DMI TaxID=3126391 RepID=UPI0032E37D05
MSTEMTGHRAPVYDHALVMRAREFALRAHRHQLYGDRPYIEHLDATVRVLMRMKASSTVLAAGYLHDVKEDCEDIEDLVGQFGHDIDDIVTACTGYGDDRASRMQDKARKIAANAAGAQVALADRYCNMNQCVKDGELSLLRRYAKELPLFLPTFLGVNRNYSLDMMAWANQAVPGLFEQLS